MKSKILALYLIISVFSSAQTNYLIEYDKLTDQVSYYKQTWVHGEQKIEEVKGIRLQQNDIVNVHATNVNTFAFEADIYMTGIKAPYNSGSPVATILAGFSGFGGPALRILTQLVSSPPTPVINIRGDASEKVALQKKYAAIVSDMHANLVYLTKAYSDYEKNVKIKYDKTLTQKEISAKLQVLIDQSESRDVQETYKRLVLQREQLDALKNSQVLTLDDPIWNDISLIDEKLDEFEKSYLEEEGNLKNVDLTQDLIDVESSDFVVNHTFRAKRNENYDTYASNDFMLVFKEIKGEDSRNYPIDFVKRISVPLKEPNVPYWSLGINAIVPVGGFVDYTVKEIAGDYIMNTPDSLSIAENNEGTALMSLGTSLLFDIPTQKAFIPNVQLGAAISGINKSQDKWNLNLHFGGGMSFRQFPYISLNAGFSFTQMRVLKDEYVTERPFVKPETIQFDDDYPSLFKNTFKPGLYFGIGIKL